MKKVAVYLFSKLYDCNEVSMNEQYGVIHDFCDQNGFEVIDLGADIEVDPETPSDHEGLKDTMLYVANNKDCEALVVASARCLPASSYLIPALRSFLASKRKKLIIVK